MLGVPEDVDVAINEPEAVVVGRLLEPVYVLRAVYDEVTEVTVLSSSTTL